MFAVTLRFTQLEWLKLITAGIPEKLFNCLNNLNKKSASSSMNNETIGITAEKALCLAFNINNNIEEDRVSTQICDKLLQSGVMSDICKLNGILPHTHIGGKNEKTDFLGTANGKEITISVKSLKKLDGKICPQVCGQPTYNSFYKYHPECPRRSGSRSEANTVVWNWIKNNIGDYLNMMQRNLFCCDVLILIRGCGKVPRADFLENKHYDFTKLKIGYNRPIYAEPAHKQKMGKLSEFSTGVFHTLRDGTKVRIGEFQFHFTKDRPGAKSCDIIKFRFYNKFYH